MRKIIAFSGAAGSGKTTAVGLLKNDLRLAGFVPQHISFAKALKAMMTTFYREAGLVDFQIEERLFGRLKETVDPLFGVSPRHAMQTLGTEWGRKLIHPEVWVDIAMRQFDRMSADYSKLIGVIDDARFPNEIEAIRARDGVVIKIVGRKAEGISDHVSERMDFFPDFTIHNDGSTTWLASEIRRVIGL